MEKIQFSNLQISEEIKRAVAEMGFEEATVIQTQSIPLILEGNDIIGHSQTGTGKTAAFGIPVIERINTGVKDITQALVLCPTRELAVQACEEMQKFAKYKHGISIVPVYGGQPIERQINVLKHGATIVIGTPGRIMDHLRRRTLKLNNLSMVVLDEADEMLNMGFREDIETILKDVPKTRQTILFSATMPPEILKITNEYQTNPKHITIVHHELTVPGIKQYYYEVPGGKKTDSLALLLDYHNPKRSIVFCNTKRMVDELVSEMQFRGFSPDGLHGDMKQQTRTQVMDSFKKGRTDILIATDVAARGIDVDDVDAVFNFDLPQDEEYYVHRIGRTGRAGKHGASYTLVSGRKQINELKDIQRYIKTKIELKKIPSISEIEEIKLNKLIDKIKESLQKNTFRKYEHILDKLMDSDFTSVEIACALLQMLTDSTHESVPLEDIIETEVPNNKSKKKADSKNPKVPMTRLFINVGKKDKVGANHIVGAITGESGLPGKAIGGIEIFDNFSFVEVPSEAADLVLSAMKNCVINKRVTTTEIVKKKKKVKKL